MVVTNYYNDHTEGLAGYRGSAGPVMVHTTDTTRSWVKEKNKPGDGSRDRALADAMLIDPAKPGTIDLGGRTVRVVPRAGHTASDVSLELDEPGVIFAGDLVWNGMFPNYVNAVPSQLNETVRALRKAGAVRYVPGHGPMAAAAADTVPASFGEWTLFAKSFVEVAFAAWYKELGA